MWRNMKNFSPNSKENDKDGRFELKLFLYVAWSRGPQRTTGY